MAPWSTLSSALREVSSALSSVSCSTFLPARVTLASSVAATSDHCALVNPQLGIGVGALQHVAHKVA
ncbi:MAG: hypothetical protein ACRER5_08595, partial [Pseudomonas sp.]